MNVWKLVAIFAFALIVVSSSERVSSAQAANELDGHTLPVEWNYLTTKNRKCYKVV